jgi:hypothetical protein
VEPETRLDDRADLADPERGNRPLEHRRELADLVEREPTARGRRRLRRGARDGGEVRPFRDDLLAQPLGLLARRDAYLARVEAVLPAVALAVRLVVARHLLGRHLDVPEHDLAVVLLYQQVRRDLGLDRLLRGELRLDLLRLDDQPALARRLGRHGPLQELVEELAAHRVVERLARELPELGRHEAVELRAGHRLAVHGRHGLGAGTPASVRRGQPGGQKYYR